MCQSKKINEEIKVQIIIKQSDPVRILFVLVLRCVDNENVYLG